MENTPICDKTVLEQWLKSGVMKGGIKEETTEGTPQGGIISPTLCNIALNGLEEAIKSCGKKIRGITPGIKVIRYADDVIVTGKTVVILEKCLEELKKFIKIRGLEVNETKTKITNINKGIDFLGFNIRRQKWL